MPRKRVFPSLPLLRSLACVLGVGLLVASSTQAALPTQTIGYDPINPEYDPNDHFKTGTDLSLANGVELYIPFAFDFGGGEYSLDSIQLLLTGVGDASSLSLLATSALGTDPILATFSCTGAVPALTSAVFTFNADSPSLLTSGSTYYLRITLAGAGDPQWVSNQWQPGVLPAQGSNPTTSGGASGGSSGSPDVTLTPLMTLNPGLLTFRFGSTNKSGIYGISMTATAVPEPGAFALVVVGFTLGAGLFFRLRRRRRRC